MLPKILGILWERGNDDSPVSAPFDVVSIRSPVVYLEKELALGAFWINEVRFGLHVHRDVRDQRESAIMSPMRPGVHLGRQMELSRR